MTKLIAVVLLSVSAAACGAKKADTTPTSVEHKGDATGGAKYGGATHGRASGQAPSQPGNPCAGTKPGY
jgi:hypothetical protein